MNGLDPEAILWIRNLLKRLASDGRTVFVSSHLTNEMAVTADHLIVIGRGKLMADCTTEEFIERSSEKSVLVKSPDVSRLAELITADGGVIAKTDDDEVTVRNLPAPRIGHLAAGAGIELHELAPQAASLEEAFMELTRGSVEYGGSIDGAAAPSLAEGGAA